MCKFWCAIFSCYFLSVTQPVFRTKALWNFNLCFTNDESTLNCQGERDSSGMAFKIHVSFNIADQGQI